MKDLQEGDVLTAKEALYIERLEGLWDSLSTAVENGELDDFKSAHPQAYSDLVERMAELQSLESGRHRLVLGGQAGVARTCGGDHAPL